MILRGIINDYLPNNIEIIEKLRNFLKYIKMNYIIPEISFYPY